MRVRRFFGLLGATFLALVIAAADTTVAAPKDPNPPVEVGGTFDDPGTCSFPVLTEYTGKAKTITLPNGGFIATSPKLTTTLTNGATGKAETVTITSAGSSARRKNALGISTMDVRGSAKGRRSPFDVRRIQIVRDSIDYR